MCNTCCKQCQGWCGAFTAIEVLLSILEVALLIVFIVFLTFLILHLIVCPDNEKESNQIFNKTMENVSFSEPTQSGEAIQATSTLSPNIQCTWTPSEKTKASTHYFESNSNLLRATAASTKLISKKLSSSSYDNGLHPDETDGDATDDKKVFVLSLVKMKTPNNIIYGCILTIISEFWTVTAASCIESIEEENSLDSFVMLDNVDDSQYGRTHVVSEVAMHPQYQGINKTYDIIALKSTDALSTNRNLLKLPTMIDYFLLTIGDRLLIMGFGKFRSRTNRMPPLHKVYEAAVHVLPTRQCRPHRGTDDAASLCVGALYARGAACNYCAGTPLLQGSTLYGIMSDNKLCGVSCEPALYVNLAAVSDWLHFVIQDN